MDTLGHDFDSNMGELYKLLLSIPNTLHRSDIETIDNAFVVLGNMQYDIINTHLVNTTTINDAVKNIILLYTYLLQIKNQLAKIEDPSIPIVVNEEFVHMKEIIANRLKGSNILRAMVVDGVAGVE